MVSTSISYEHWPWLIANMAVGALEWMYGGPSRTAWRGLQGLHISSYVRARRL